MARFSQFAEDALFLAIFNPGSAGFYIDAGAYHPCNGSNTYRLYLMGWRGLTIEPNPMAAKRFRKMRPRDQHLIEGIASGSGSLEYFFFKDEKMNTFSKSRADFLASVSRPPLKSQIVPCRPLNVIIDEHCPEMPIDLLSVDCEDLDLEVLQSLDLRCHRPVAIMVEDFDELRCLRDGSAPGPIGDYLAKNDYKPVSQAAFTTLYAATDWRYLVKRSSAFEASRMSGSGILL
jgi:FkbM family methyltransferase